MVYAADSLAILSWDPGYVLLSCLDRLQLPIQFFLLETWVPFS